ncbi:LOW QUALITY PROTEIN: uncharacterized protein LOC143253002 [Tachypleus tridentatus]|uniref:LOW QUALITY PROTEIN: uncharacterized protein LOC143253002 n=1 Tax=Tachypleus tridentatus TaxID=6853 RepID=UPI003FD45B0D
MMSSKGSCPGFQPHTVKPTRCRRCFRDLGMHKPEEVGIPQPENKKSTTTRDSDKTGMSLQKDDTSASITLSLPRKKHETETTERIQASKETKPKASAKDEVSKGRKRETETAEKIQVGKEIKPKASAKESVSKGSDNKTSRKPEKSPNIKTKERTEPDGASVKSNESSSDSSGSESSKAKRIKILAAKEIDKFLPSSGESFDEDTSPDVAFILRVKTSSNIVKDLDLESVAATECTEATETTLTFQETIEDLQAMVSTLKKQLETSEEKCDKLEKEKKEIMQRRLMSEGDNTALEKTASEILKLRSKVHELEALNEELTDDKKVLTLELKELQQELDKRQSPQQMHDTIKSLQTKLHQAEGTCEEITEENEELKREIRDLEEELEELHDSFREEQASEFQDLKKDLENQTKNCRVLQFKLRKAEKKCERQEIERTQLEEKLKDLQATSKIDVDQSRMKELESKLHVTKEIAVKMKDELQGMKETNKKLEEEKESLLKQMLGTKEAFNATQQTKFLKSHESSMGKDYESILRDLYDTMERETDLREQLRYAEDETRNLRKKLSTMEQENETLILQLRKMSGRERSEKDDEEVSVEELSLQLELSEQEIAVLRRKVDDLEQQNENFQTEVKYLEEKLVSKPTIEIPDNIDFSPDSFQEQKLKLLDYEAKELRRKLIEKEKENEKLRTEVEVHRRKASKVMVRSRSLDSDVQVDLKRQLHLVEQEAGILRQKTMELETENENLLAENKRLQLRVSRKPPPGPADQLQLANMELRDKVQELEKKVSNLKEELEKTTVSGSMPATVIQDYRPRKESLTDTESDLIASLKKQIKNKEDEISCMQTKILQLEIQNTKVSRDYKKLKDNLNYKKKAPRLVRETATRLELKEIIRDLEDEISELQVTLRGVETVHETSLEEMEKVKRELEVAQKELKQKEENIDMELCKQNEKMETLEKQAEKERKKAQSLQDQLESLAKEQQTDLLLIEKVRTLKQEKENLDKKITTLEQQNKEEKKSLQELQNKLEETTELKKELEQKVEELEVEQQSVEKEAERQKILLNQAQEQIHQLNAEVEKSETDLSYLKKQCHDLKNELEQERTKYQQTDNRQTEMAVGWLKERGDLKRQLNELRLKLDALKHKTETQEAQYNERETKLKDKHKEHLDKAVKEAVEEIKAQLETANEENAAIKAKITEVTEKLEKREKDLKEITEKHRHLVTTHRKEREEWEGREEEMENHLRTEFKKRERMEKEHDQELRQKDEELLASRDKIVHLERDQRKAASRVEQLQQEYEEKVKQMEREFARERLQYEELTSRYEQLEGDHVKIKARLVMEKEQVEANLTSLKRDYEETCSELKSLRETYNVRQDTWIKEKLDFQERMKEMENKVMRMSNVEQEKLNLKGSLEERDSLIESYKREEKHLKEERDKMRRKIEDLSRKVVELERAERTSRTISITGRQEMYGLRTQLEHSEHVQKANLGALRADYEDRIVMMGGEIEKMGKEILKLTKERDHYREQLAQAEKSLGELKSDVMQRERSKLIFEIESIRRSSEELKRKLLDTEQKLDQANMENRNLKVQYEADKNQWQVLASDMKSKLNQIEEKNILEGSRGGTKTYARTRLQLVWEKERNEQQHLLADTQHLVNELRDKLINLEHERDNEKQDFRKQVESVKSAYERDHLENQKKVAELQADLVELRDSNAKFRAASAKLYNDKQMLEREREEWRKKCIVVQNIQSKVSNLLKEVESLNNMLEKEEKSTEATVEDMRKTVEKVKHLGEEVRQLSTSFPEEDRVKRTISFRRAISASEFDKLSLQGSPAPSTRWRNPQKVSDHPAALSTILLRAPPRQKSLNKKSLSLDQTLSSWDSRKIWQSGEESNVTTPSGSQLSLRLSQSRSIDYESDSSLGETSIDSKSLTLPRLSHNKQPSVSSSREGSTTGSFEPSPALKPKKGLKEKLKKLTRSKSIEHTSTTESVDQAELGSVIQPEKQEKEKSLRSRISKVLKKPLSRSSSIDRSQSDRETPKDLVPERVQKLESESTHKKGTPTLSARGSSTSRVSEKTIRSKSIDKAPPIEADSNKNPTPQTRSRLSKESSLSDTENRSGVSKQPPFSETAV